MRAFDPKLIGRLLDKAILAAGALAVKHVGQLRSWHPDATEEDLTRYLDREFKLALTGQGAAAGSAATVPGFGTAAGLALAAGGDAAVAVNLTALYVLALAEVHDVRLEDIAQDD